MARISIHAPFCGPGRGSARSVTPCGRGTGAGAHKDPSGEVGTLAKVGETSDYFNLHVAAFTLGVCFHFRGMLSIVVSCKVKDR